MKHVPKLRCSNCGYDLAGHFKSAETHAKCPECGRVVTHQELEMRPPITKSRALIYSVAWGFIPTGLTVICGVFGVTTDVRIALLGVPLSTLIGAGVAAISASTDQPAFSAPSIPRHALFVLAVTALSFAINATAAVIAFFVFGFPTRIC